MSLLGNGSSSTINPPEDDLDGPELDDLSDGFGDAAEDDDLSLDGLSDNDDNYSYIQNTPPPNYEEPAFESLFSKVSDIKNIPIASGGSAFAKPSPERNFPILNFLRHNRVVPPNSPPPRSAFLPSDPIPSLPQDPPGGPSPNALPRTYYPGVDVCIVCQSRPPYSKNGKSYPTCGLTCAGILDYAVNGNKSPPGTTGYTPQPPAPRRSYLSPIPVTPQTNIATPVPVNPNIHLPSFLAGVRLASENALAVGNKPSPRPRGGYQAQRRRPQPMLQDNDFHSSPAPSLEAGGPCVVCQKPLAANSKYITCDLACAEKLSIGGGTSPNMCTYCHRHPKLASQNQCGQVCAQAAKVACLFCKSRPKFKHYHLCGRTCKQLSTKKTPLLLEVPMDHVTWEMVQKKFDDAWKYGPKPAIKKIYKIIESNHFLLPYDKYKKTIGRNTEVFRYHGTSRKCKLGSNGNTTLCNDNSCALCCILKTSFQTSFANPHGAFGAGIYSSSSANKAYSFANKGQGAILLTKVILGKVYKVGAFGAVSSCPSGYNSVVFDRLNGDLNETIVYSDDAIRPVFLIMFA